jgi:hypothetical protein
MAWDSESTLRDRLRQHNDSRSLQADRDFAGRTAKGWTMFYSLLHYWQAKNTYRSAFAGREKASRRFKTGRPRPYSYKAKS